MEKKPRHRIRVDTAVENVNNVFEKEDFKRQLQEVALKENLPLEVVDAVIKNYLMTITLTMFRYKFLKKRITLYGFMNIEVLPYFKKGIKKNLNHKL